MDTQNFPTNQLIKEQITDQMANSNLTNLTITIAPTPEASYTYKIGPGAQIISILHNGTTYKLTITAEATTEPKAKS